MMFLTYRTFWQLIVCFLIFSTAQSKAEEDVWMTVFIHGIMSIQAHLSISLISKLFCDNVTGTLYADTIKQMRQDEFFQHNQLMQEPGLHPIFPIGNNAKTASQVLATLYDIAQKSTGQVEKNLYYTFGWSGLLSNCERKRTANVFYIALCKEVERLKKKGLRPKIRLIGYSHGGNICLDLAESKYKFQNKKLSVDELILIGCPIHDASIFLVMDPLFKSVYNLYSKRDQIQTLDCFSTPDLFSKRRFFNKKNVVIPSKVTQSAVAVTHAIGEPNCFYENKFCFTKRLQRLRSLYYLKDESAGHIELWFLGWTPKHYRKKIVLYPYPILVFTPCIIDALKKSGLEQNDTRYQLMVNLRPDFEEIIVTGEKKRYEKSFPYRMLVSQFDPIVQRAEPTEYTKKSSNEFILINKKRAIEKRQQKGIPSIQNKRLRNFFVVRGNFRKIY